MFRAIWWVVATPIYLVLRGLRVVGGFFLFWFGALGIFVALAFRFLLHLRHFSFWTVLLVSVGCLVALLFYDALVELLRPRWHGASRSRGT
jgi:hypothetical protein